MRAGEETLRTLLAPIQDALDDPLTTDIVIQNPTEVGIHRAGKWTWREVPEFTFERLDAIALLAGHLLSKDFDPAHPTVDTALPDRHRFTAIRPPIIPTSAIAIAIRNPFRGGDHGAGELDDRISIAQHAPNPTDHELLRLYREKNAAAFFPLAVRAGKHIAATGAAGTGKTTFLRRCMRYIPPEERLITIEDNEEFGELQLRNRVTMIYGSAGVTAENLVITSLRMAPDRIAMQELRGSEAYAYLRIGSAGHRGGFTSWHAEDADPFTPLSLMVKSSEEGRAIPDPVLHAQLRNLFDIIAHCRRDPVTREILPPTIYYRAADMETASCPTAA